MSDEKNLNPLKSFSSLTTKFFHIT